MRKSNTQIHSALQDHRQRADKLSRGPLAIVKVLCTICDSIVYFAYVDSTRDVRSLTNVVSLRDFERFLRAAHFALRIC